jgi:uncharacterized tellurite resistance protein B-like protein
MFGRWSSKTAEDPEGHALGEAVARELGGMDPDTRRIVTAIAGLLGGVAYADRDYSAPEEAVVRSALGQVRGLTPSGISAILDVLRRDIVHIATVQAPRYCRTLLELGDRELRLQVLDMLLDLAAADGTLSHDEAVLLRNTTQSLGLAQSDYNHLQSRHRDKLSVLR